MTGGDRDAESRRTRRWRGVLAVAFGAGGLGLLAKRPSLLLLSSVGIVFAAYPWLTTQPALDVDLDRRVSDTNPGHGEAFSVTTTVRNVGDDPLFDLRVVDGVPPALSVTDGSPRHGTALRAGESATFTYEIEARHGQHRFEPATVVARDPSGAHETVRRIAAETETEVTCTSGVVDPPLRDQTTASVGRLVTDSGGGGIEFHRTRSYRPGDPLRRIDWKRYARTGELTTVEYREERAAAVVVAVDARPVAYRGQTDEPHGVAYGVAAAHELLDVLLAARNRFGLTAFGAGDCWLAPAAGTQHLHDCRRLLSEHAAFSPRPPSECPPLDDQVATLRGRLPDGAQVLLVSPLCDDDVVSATRLLDAEGHQVSVVSVDVTERGTPGRTLAAIERNGRVRMLRHAEIPVVDWHPGEPLEAAFRGARGDRP